MQGTEEEKRRCKRCTGTVTKVIDSFTMFEYLDVADSVREPSEKEKFLCMSTVKEKSFFL